MTDPNFSAIRARLRYESLDDFIDGYSRFISTGGMFIPMAPSKLKPVGTTIRFQFLLQDGATAMLGEGVVRQIQGADSDDNSAVGMLVKFTKLSRESKKVVERVVARKSDAQSRELAPDSEQLQAPTPETPANSAPAHDDFEADDDSLPQADDAQTRDADKGDAGVLAADDDEDDQDVDDAPAADVAASGSDVFSEADSDSEPVDAKPDAVGGPKELGRTEAGLQIMAFDEVSDDEMAGFGEFDFGGDEDDVDQMFDGIFGGGGDSDGGGLFGGGGDDDGDGGGLFGGGGDDALVADSVNDGGSPIEDESDASDETDEPVGETFDLDQEVDETFDLEVEVAQEVDETFDLEKQYDLGEQSASDALAEDSVDETFDLEEEVELDEESAVDEVVELEDDAEFEEDVELDEEVEFDEEVELEDDAELDDELDLAEQSDLEAEDAQVLAEESEPDAAGASDEPTTDKPPTGEDADADVAVDEDVEKHEPVVPPAPETPAGLGQESSAVSEDLMSALGSLDSDGEQELELSIGVDAADEEESQEAQEDDDEESLESLLALAHQDIDAKREVKEEDDQGDILDDLLGGDDMPPPPTNDPVFDIGDGDTKKKKGGFMSKLFGKD